MHVAAEKFDSANGNKANFDSIYDQDDPREYFRVLCGLDYVIPDLAKNIFRSVIKRYAELSGGTVKVVDLGCSYGINSALVRYPLDIRRLAARYASPGIGGLSAADLLELDKHYYRAWPEQVDACFVGCDCSGAAVSYATKVGLIDYGVTSNLEETAPTPDEAACLEDADIIVSTGCIGYVTHKTFRKILSLQKRRGKMPWVANFVLRMFPYDTIAAELEQFGLVTEKLEGVTFVQRRFQSENELNSTLAALKELDLDTRGKETDGLLHAELFVSRPRDDIHNIPLSEIVNITSGISQVQSGRFRRMPPPKINLIH